jgi:hypothetical protein
MTDDEATAPAGRPFHGLFELGVRENGHPAVVHAPAGPMTLPCPSSGRSLRVATLQPESQAICPRCEAEGHGGFVTFVGDLRMVYACPACRELVWLAGV